MKKNTAHTEDGLKKLLHEMISLSDEEMDKHELKSYIDDENQPKMRMLNESDVSVGEVLIIGAYLALNHIHHEMHRDDAEEVKANLEKVLEGKVKFRTITPDNMPEELKDLLEKLISPIIKDRKKGKK